MHAPMTSRWTVARLKTFAKKWFKFARWYRFFKKVPDCDIHHDLYYFWMKIFRRNGILKHDWTKKKIREKWKYPTKGRREQYSGEREGNLLMREKTRMEKD